MKNINPQLLAIIKAGRFSAYAADLYEFTLANGTVLRLTSGDQDIVFGGNTFSAGGSTGPLIRTESDLVKLHAALGLAADQIEFDLLPGTATISSFPFVQAARIGLLDGAALTIWRAFMQTYGDVSLGPVKVFVGKLGAVVPLDNSVHVTVNSAAILFNTKLPKNTFSATCNNEFGDAACTFDVESTALNGTVIAVGSTAAAVKATVATSRTVNYWALGRLAVTSGQLAGLSFPIKTSTTGLTPTFALWRPMPIALANGTTIRLYRGCNKVLVDSLNGCASHQNGANFRGHPYVPPPEAAV